MTKTGQHHSDRSLRSHAPLETNAHAMQRNVNTQRAAHKKRKAVMRGTRAQPTLLQEVTPPISSAPKKRGVLSLARTSLTGSVPPSQ